MEAHNVCQKCQRPAGSTAPHALCPACLLGAMLPGGDVDEPVENPGTAKMGSFGSYELLEEIAHGGMGIVYKARQGSLNRMVALKMVLGGKFAGQAELKRFQGEAEAIAELDHPNIVPIYEVGEHEGQPYFSMKLIAGGSLSTRLAKSPLSNRVGATLLATAARAVHYAHQHGILHRDIKPANILIDASGQPHLTDFGLAKNLKGDSSLTLSGAVMGTPAYMAPEQAAGKNRQVTGAADVYSLGAILYQILAGRPPFQADTPLETLRKVTDEEPKRPSSINIGADADLEIICLKCLEKAPHRRYASAEQLAEDLERWLRDEPIRARPVTPLERSWKWIKRRPAFAAMGGVTLLALTFAIVSVSQPKPPPSPPPPSSAPRGGLWVTSSASDGDGSLRDLISKAEPGATVRFADALSGQTIRLTHGELVIDKDLAIVGPGRNQLTISGNRLSRVFHLRSNSVVTLTGVTVAEGRMTSRVDTDRGGGFRVEPGASLTLKQVVMASNFAIAGGAILNHGSVQLEEVTLRDNSAVEGGGGIYNEGFLRMNRVTFSTNVSPLGGGGLGNLNGTVLAHNTTFIGNDSAYCAVWNFSKSAGITLDSCTVSGNAIGLGNSKPPNDGTFILRNTIVAGNKQDIMDNGVIRSAGHNLIGRSASFGSVQTDLVGTDSHPIDPNLGPLANNGGATLTLLLLSNSPAIGAGEYTGLQGNALALDQRGVARPGNGPCAIGAVEVKPPRR